MGCGPVVAQDGVIHVEASKDAECATSPGLVGGHDGPCRQRDHSRRIMACGKGTTTVSGRVLDHRASRHGHQGAPPVEDGTATGAGFVAHKVR